MVGFLPRAYAQQGFVSGVCMHTIHPGLLSRFLSAYANGDCSDARGFTGLAGFVWMLAHERRFFRPRQLDESVRQSWLKTCKKIEHKHPPPRQDEKAGRVLRAEGVRALHT